MTKKQYNLMLDSAKNHLEKTIEIISQYKISEEPSIYLSQNIRYFAVDIESALDYIAYDLFNAYFLPVMKEENKSASSIERKQRNINFPNYKEEKVYNKKIKDIFPRLYTLQPEIALFLKEIQPFNHKNDSIHWLTSLNDLVNSNKHRHLSVIHPIENADIEYLELPNNIVLQNVSIRGSKKAVVIGDTTLSNTNAKSLGVTDFKGTIENVLAFESDNQSVEETLEDIYCNSKIAIGKLDDLIKRI